MELLDKCNRGNEIAPIWHHQVEQGTHAEGVQFYCLASSTYPAIELLLLIYFIAYLTIEQAK